MLHYNAFISYRHVPADSEIAGMLQKRLENYRIPKNIQRRTGIKKISRIFRDKEELPITYDLNDDIENALKNSDYLIVICSTSTAQSKWVTKEIETFLKYHKKQDVFTVLVDGEPYDVIPKVLLSDEIYLDEPNGEVKIQHNLLEPLSCDLRHKPKKAIKTEILRLLARMLGCPYDELYQRHRRRRMKQIIGTLMSITALAVLFSVYAVNRAMVISHQSEQLAEAYQKALISESEILTQQAKRHMEENDTFTALRLILKALPSSEQDRPVLPEAVYILGRLLGIYEDEQERFEAPCAEREIQFENNVDYVLDTTGERLLIRDKASEQLSVWDSHNFSEMYSWPEYRIDNIEKVLQIKNSGRYIINFLGRVECVDAKTGKQYWLNDDFSYMSVPVLSFDEEEVYVFECLENGKASKIKTLSVQDGNCLRTVQIQLQKSDITALQFAVSENGAYAAVVYEIRGDSLRGSKKEVNLIDMYTGEVIATKVLPYDVEKLRFCEDRLLLLGYSGDWAHLYTITSYNPGEIWMECMSSTDLAYVWSVKERTAMESIEAKIVPIPSSNAENKYDSVAFAYANYCVLVDWDSGDELQFYPLTSVICGAKFYVNGAKLIASDGTYNEVRWNENKIISGQYFNGNVKKAFIHDDNFFIQQSWVNTTTSRIAEYSPKKPDCNYEYITQEEAEKVQEEAESVKKQYHQNPEFVLMEDGSLINADGLEVCRITPVKSVDIAGLTVDKQKVWVVSHTGTLSLFDVMDGQETGHVFLQEYGVFSSFNSYMQLLGDGTGMLFVGTYCYVLDFTSNEPTITAVVPYCYAYDADINKFYIRGDPPKMFHRYTLEELIIKGNDQLSSSN